MDACFLSLEIFFLLYFRNFRKILIRNVSCTIMKTQVSHVLVFPEYMCVFCPFFAFLIEDTKCSNQSMRISFIIIIYFSWNQSRWEGLSVREQRQLIVCLFFHKQHHRRCQGLGCKLLEARVACMTCLLCRRKQTERPWPALSRYFRWNCSAIMFRFGHVMLRRIEKT